MSSHRRVVNSYGGMGRITGRWVWLFCPLLVLNQLQVAFAPSPGIGDYVLPGHNGCLLKWVDERGFTNLEKTEDDETLSDEEKELGRCMLECLRIIELRPTKEVLEKVQLFGVMDQQHDAFVGCSDICPENIEVTCEVNAKMAKNQCTGKGPVKDHKGDDLGNWDLEIDSDEGIDVWIKVNEVPGANKYPALKKKWEKAFAPNPDTGRGIDYVVDVERSSSLLLLQKEVHRKKSNDNIIIDEQAESEKDETPTEKEETEQTQDETGTKTKPLGGKVDDLGNCAAFGVEMRVGVVFLPVQQCEKEQAQTSGICSFVVKGMTKNSCSDFCQEYDGYTSAGTFNIADQTMVFDSDENACKALEGDKISPDSIDASQEGKVCRCVNDNAPSISEDELEGVEVEVTPEDLRGTTCSMDMQAPTVCSDVFCCDCPDNMELVIVTKVWKIDREVSWTKTDLRNLLACACSSDEENPTPANPDKEDENCQCEPGSVTEEEPIGNEPSGVWPAPIEKGDGFYCPSPETNAQEKWKGWKEGGDQGENWLSEPFGLGPNGEWEQAHKLWMARNGHWFAKDEGDENEGKKRKGKKVHDGVHETKKGAAPDIEPSMLVLCSVAALLLLHTSSVSL